MRTVSLMLGIVLLATAAVGAQERQRAVLPVTINQIPRGETLSFIEDGDVLMPKTFFDQFNIRFPGASAVNIEGESYLSLKSLSPSVQFTLDVENLQLAMTVDPHFLGREVLSIGRQAAATPEQGGDPAVFLNYALSGQRDRSPDAFTEIGATRGHTLLYSGLSRSTGRVVRGLTFYDIDVPSRLQRWTAGDAVAGNDVLGGIVTMGGITLSREFSLQPYFIRTPGVDLSGVATTPSTVEVYVNGQLMNRIAVQPGTFTLRDVPVTGGLGNTQLVVRDAFGRQTVQQASFYLSTTALRKGLSDYVFSAGYIRNDLTRSFDYDRPAVLAQYRRGLTNSVTLGGRGEAADGLASGGPRATISSRVGDLDLNFGASRADQLSGTASSIAYRFQALHFSFGTAWIHRSDHYATLSLRPSDDRVTRDLNGFISVGVGPVTVGVVGSQSDTRAGQQSRQVALQTTVPLSRWGSVFASLGRIERNGDSEPAVIIGMTISVGRLTTANIGYQKSGKTAGVQMAVRRPLSLENGYGYEIERDSITDRQFASLQYQSSFGRYRVDVDPQNAEDFSYGISGGLVRIGDRFLFSRPVQDSFALARVGVPNVMVYSSNQPVGRTNRFGDLLVPHLLPYYANPLSISDKDVPMDYEVEATQVIAVPPARGGIIAQFPVRRLRTFTGAMRLMIVGVPYVPSLGQVDVTVPGDQALVLSLGRGGEFYAEDLQPGTYPARLRIGKVHCDFELTIPPSEASQTDLGVIPCTP